MTYSGAPQRHRFVVLDGLRGGGAIMVVIAHSSNFAPMTYLVIGFFFLLSGFVLAHSAAEKLQVLGRQGRLDKIRFSAGRLIRLYPLYFAGTAIALPPAAAFAAQNFDFWTLKVIAEALAAAPFFIPLPYEYSFPLDMPAWTLTFELLVNALFLFTGWRWLPCLMITLVSLPLMLCNPGNAYWEALAGELPIALFCYFLGVVMCRVWCEDRLPKFGLHPLALLAILCGLYAYPPRNEFLYAALLTVIIQPWILWAGACSVASGFSARVMAWLGKISYGIYVLHFPILMWVTGTIGWLEKFHPRLAGRLNNVTVLIVLPLSLLAAQLLTTHLDAPLRKWLSRQLEAVLLSRKAAVSSL